MKDFLETLSAYLDSLTELNIRLLAALREYQDLLVDGAPGNIEKATPIVDRLTNEVRRLEEERRKFVDGIFSANGWTESRNFSNIKARVEAEGVSDDDAVAFERATRSRSNLIEILAQVDAQNTLNMTLVGQGLTFAEVSFRTLLGSMNKQDGYGPSKSSEEGPSFLDAQV